MNFDEFQKRAPLYVLGALEPPEMKEFEQAAKRFGQKAEDFVRECHALHDALALTLRPAKSLALLKDRLMSMVESARQC